MATANDVLSIARGEIGYSRWNDPNPGTKYGRWYAQLTGQRYYGQSGVPYCAMFASWVFNKAGAKCAGLPGAYTPSMWQAAKNAGAALSNKRNCQPGDIVYFNWDGGVVDHVGIIEKNCGSYAQTIEGNTSNGRVLRRTRAWSTIEGCVRPNWSGASTNSATHHSNSSSSSRIDEDGYWGPATSRRLQQYLGTPVDGVISSQNAAIRKSNPGLTSASWQWVGRPAGSTCITALQRKIGSAPDGIWGPNTCKALQKYLGTPVDGVVSGPSTMVKALQKRLNANNL